MRLDSVPVTVAADMQSAAAEARFQNIFEHQQASQAGQTGLTESLGDKLFNRLESFVARGQEISGSTEKPGVDVPGDRVAAAIDALEKMFDRSIEVQLVVRGATGTSGSANTLLKGQ